MARPTHIPLTSPDSGSVGAWLTGAAIAGLYVATLIAIARGGTARLVILAGATFALRGLVLAFGYHLYFVRRAFEVSRPMQLVLAVLGTTAGQGGPLTWTAIHRMRSPASPRGSNLVDRVRASRAGLFVARAHEAARLDLVPELAGYPELRLVDRWSIVGPLTMMVLLLAIGGVDALLWGFCVSTCALFHATVTLGLFERT